MLKDISLSKTQFSLPTLVKKTAGLSSSDLKEVCRNATMVPVREFMNSKKGLDGEIDLEELGKSQGEGGMGGEGFKIRELRNSDFFVGEGGVESEILD